MKNVFIIAFVFIQILVFTSCKNSGNSDFITNDTSLVTHSKNPEPKTLKEHSQTEINVSKSDTLNKTSEAFTINAIKCYWEFTLIIYDKATGGEGTLKLRDQKTHRILLENKDYYYRDYFDAINKYDEFNFKDLNFDGFKDFSTDHRTSSGTAGSFENIYLFNNSTKAFELSEELSGYDIEIDSLNKIIYSYGKSGNGYKHKKIHYLGENGKIKYSDKFNTEPLEKGNFLVVYKKIINKKVVKTGTDTISYEEYMDNWN
jgi:hypothetical protein